MEVERALPTGEVILDASMHIRFPAERLQRAPNLKLFVTATTGSDHIDAVALAQAGIPLLTLKGQREVLRNITAAAEHSWLLLLACARHLRPALNDVLAGVWDRQRYPGILLRGKTLGIIGCGRIGEWMSRYATAFGMKCLGYDPYISPWPETIENSSLEVVLSQSDFITVHVPLNDETRGLLGSREFSLVKSGAVLINTSRGEIVEESALSAALQAGRLAAAGLDVLQGEPEIAQNRLIEYARNHANLIITPHIGGYSPDAVRYVLSFSCERIVDFFKKA
jgi:D-3-phosphoglycerate dehydrogenase